MEPLGQGPERDARGAGDRGGGVPVRRGSPPGGEAEAERIQLGPDGEVKVIGRRNFQMSLIRLISTIQGVYLAWLIKGEIRTHLNCIVPCLHKLTIISFITYRPVPHLDRKHTVFGKVVGGLEILDKLENIPTDHDERPQQEIKINKLLIFVDPFNVVSCHVFPDS